MKPCVKCGNEIDGSHNSYCKSCFSAYVDAKRRAADPGKYAIIDSVNAVRATWESRGLRQCESCGAILPWSPAWFSPSKKSRGGCTYQCHACATVSRNQTPSARARKRRYEESAQARRKAEKDRLFSSGASRCGECGEVKPLEMFCGDSRARNGIRNRCKQCEAQRKRPRKYAPHTTACRDYYITWCSAGCAICGEARDARIIHAHHRDESKKSHHINKLNKMGEDMLELIQYELSKCEPLCANCHALVHIELDNGGKGLSFDDLVSTVREKYPA